MISTGKVPKPWNTVGTVQITDALTGNVLTLPTTGAVSIAFSIISILKAAIEFNVYHVHIDSITDSRKFCDFIRTICDHIAFLTTSTCFRIASIVMAITYLGTFGSVPIAIFWIVHLIIGYKKYVEYFS